MIIFASPLPCGNAAKLVLRPPDNALAWRVLRRTDGAFTGPDDPEASHYEGDPSERLLVDYVGLTNGTTYVYRVYYRYAGDIWAENGQDATITPQANYEGDTPDPQDVLIDRIGAGLEVEVARGMVHPPHGAARIDVLRAFNVFEQSRLPCVTVEFVSSETQDRAIGEQWGPDDDQGATWREWDGWKRHVTLAVAAWTLNADERVALRQALERIFLANLPVFDAAGLYNIDVQWQDVWDDLQYDAPVYSAVATVTLTALSRVGAAVGKIADVQVAPACGVVTPH